MQKEFTWSELPNPHHHRTKEIIKNHPEVKQLIGKNPWSFPIIVCLVAAQVLTSYLLRDAAWWLIVLVAYTSGAIISHALWVMIHETSHNLIFKKKSYNTLAGIFANMPHLIPSSVSFQHYHIKHHAHQGEYNLDADLPDYWEARLFHNHTIGKAFWLLVFPFFQVFHTIRISDYKKFDRWIFLNYVVQIVFISTIVYFFGVKSLVFLFISFLFSVGLHPLGARWIQEHFLVLSKEQETYSYYGYLNKISFNVGYHNEHHDFPSVPWNRLPQLKKTADPYYSSLLYHKSWTGLLLRFIFDPMLSVFSRTLRQGNSRKTKPVQ